MEHCLSTACRRIHPKGNGARAASQNLFHIFHLGFDELFDLPLLWANDLDLSWVAR